MPAKIGVGLAVNGEAEFKAAIKDVNNELKLLNSESKLIKETYQGNEKSLEALTAKHSLLTRQLEQTEKKTKLNQEQMESWQKVQEAAAERAEELRDELEKAQEKMETLRNASSTTEDELQKQQETIDSLNRELESAENTYTRAGDRVNQYRVNINNTEAQVQRLNRELEENDRCMEEAEQSTNSTSVSIDEYKKTVEDAAQKTTVFGDILKANLLSSAIEKGTEMITQGIKDISSAVVSTGSAFETSMSNVAATMGMTADEIAAGSEGFERLKEAASEAGKTTQFSAGQAADALNYLALAGYDVDKATAALPSVLNLAAAGGLDLAYASDLVTDSMSALNMEVSDLDLYIDEMARTAQKSNTSVGMLGEATLVCAGAVTMSNQSLETMNAELGILANNGIKGAEGGTHLRNIILSLTSPTDKAADAMAGLGLQVADSEGNIKDLNVILTELNGKLSSMTEAEKTNVLSTIFNKTDLSAINALLKGTGKEFDSLYAELMDCNGAAANMAQTMNANLAGSVKILGSALEALGNSAYDKIQGTLKDSVDAATDSVGRLQTSMDEGELGEAMDNFAESLGNAADQAIDFAEDALPVVVDGLSWILDNADLIISGIAGIAAMQLELNAAQMYQETVAPAIRAVVDSWNAYKTANEGATVAQWAMNAAQAANPAGILLTALAGLIALLGTYALLADDATDATQEMLEKNRQHIDSLNQSVEKRKESTAANEAEIRTIRSLKEDISVLNEKESLSVEEKQRMAVMVNELNQALPELNLQIDEQTGKLIENTESWEQNVEAQLNALEMQFKQEDLTEIAKERYDAEKQLMELEEQMRLQEEETTAAREKYNQVLGETIEKYGDFPEFYETAGTEELAALNKSISAQEELQDQYDETQALIQNLTNEYSNLSEGMQEMEAAAEENREVLIEYNGTMYNVSQSTDVAIASMENLQTAYWDAKSAAVDTVNAQVSLFQELSMASDLTVQQMTSNLQSQAEVFNTYSEDLKKAADMAEQGLLDEGMLGAIQELGIDGAGYLHELVTAAETDIETFNELMVSWADMQEAKDALTDTMADVQTDYSDQMEALLGIAEEKNEAINSSITDTVDDVQAKVVKANEDIKDDTESTMKAIDNTVKKEGATVTKTAVAVSKDTTDSVKTELGIGENGESAKFKEIGLAIDEGMTAGIKAGKSSVINAAVEVAVAAYKAAKEALGINSPSKLFSELGYWSSEGYAEGMVQHLDEVKQNIQDSMRAIAEYDEQSMPYGTGEMEAGDNRNMAVGNINLTIQPQTLSEEELDMTFEYLNRRFGLSL